jgi:putative transposase
VETALAEAGGLADTPAGRRSYADYLAWQAAAGPVGKNAAYVSLSQGWALGTEGFKAALAKDHALATEARAWGAAGVREIREQQWAELLAAGLRRAGKTAAEAQSERKSAAWKIALAAEMKQTTQVPNGWLAERLHMGSGMAVSQYVGQWRRAQAGRAEAAGH